MKTTITIFTTDRKNLTIKPNEYYTFEDCYSVDAELTHTVAEITIDGELFEVKGAYHLNTSYCLDCLRIYVHREV